MKYVLEIVCIPTNQISDKMTETQKPVSKTFPLIIKIKESLQIFFF